MSVFEIFMERRFPRQANPATRDGYYQTWVNRFAQGIDYAMACMDRESLAVFKQIINEKINSVI